MMDILMLALGFGFFALAIGYTYAANGFEGAAMIFDYSLAGAVSLGLLFYLTYALLRPERF
jgi:K+-transporting ATPase KdpF subunit